MSILNARDPLTDHLLDNPSLKPQTAQAIETAYRRARNDARAETGLEAATFPVTRPWDFGQIMDDGFRPDAGTPDGPLTK